MNKKIIWGIVVVIILILVALYIAGKDKRAVNTNAIQATSTSQITIMVPNDLVAYENAMNDYIFGDRSNGDVNPSKNWPFVEKIITVPETTDVIRSSAEAAARLIPTQASSAKSQVVYLKIVNGTAYAQLIMDIDGWAGASVSIAMIHPIVEKTLLQFPGIKQVKFDTAPGDSIDTTDQFYINQTSTKPSIIVISPNGGETVVSGRTAYPITWKNNDAPLKVNVLLDAYDQNNNLIVSIPVAQAVDNIGTYSWNTIALDSGARYKIRITGASGTGIPKPLDSSDQYFTITN